MSRLVICLAFFGWQFTFAQCDTKVSGVFTYCNSFDNGNPVIGYFVGFRVVDPTGDTLNVVDLDGGAVTNHGKRVDNIGALEPANTSTTPLKISGVGADSIEYWYFGPYTNGSSFNIALLDPNNVCDTIFVAAGTYNCADNTGISDPSACAPSGSGPPVPLYYLDFSNTTFDLGYVSSGTPAGNTYYVMNRTRESTCCDVGGNAVRCMEMIVTLAESDFGLAIDDAGSGNTAGKLYADSLNGFVCTGNTNTTYPFQQGGGQSNDAPLCFSGVTARDYVVLSCKAGGNPTYLTIGSLSGIVVPSIVTQEGCSVSLNTFNATAAFWSSPDDPNLDNLISCQSDSLICSFSYNNGVFGDITSCTDTFTYIVGGYPPPNACLPTGTILYDTTQVVVYPSFSVDIQNVCTNSQDSIMFSAIVTSTASGCAPYNYLWSNGATTPNITVPISNLEYYVSVTRAGTSLSPNSCNTAIDSTVAVPVIIPVLPFDTICDGSSVTIQLNVPNPTYTYSWNFGSGANPQTGTGPGPFTIMYDTTTENQLNGASVMLTISRPGCPNSVGQVTHIEINPYPNSAINANTSSTCYFTEKTFQPVAPFMPGYSYNWNFGSGAVPATMTGYGPHIVYYTTSGTKTVKLCVYPNAAGAQCPDSSTVTFTITACPAQILGHIHSDDNTPIPNVTVKLFADANEDGVADNATIVRNVTTNSNGLYVMASVTPGGYVIVETQPSGWLTVDDYDNSDDGDVVTNTSGTDNLIPVTLVPSEIDSMNNFIETTQPAGITGNVFVDADGNMEPDPGEGLDSVTLKLFTDANTDGIADNNTPIATQLSDLNGQYAFSNVPVGSYVVVESNPSDYISVKDFDPSNDFDLVPNTNTVNDTIPVTLTSGEIDANNFFIDIIACPLMVLNTEDDGYGSLRYNIGCAENGDTIRFHIMLTGQTIQIISGPLMIDKNLVFISTLVPRVNIASNVIGLFIIGNTGTAEFQNLNFTGGLSADNNGTVFDNLGILKLNTVFLYKNPNLSNGDYLIRNEPGSTLFLDGICNLQMN